MPASVEAGFRYLAPEGPRPSFAAVDEDLTLVWTLRRLVPAGLAVRFDRRVDSGRQVKRSYGDWRSLLWGEGLAGDLNGNEVHVRPAGVAAGTVQLVSAERGRGNWRLNAGETLFDVLRRWGARAGVEVAVLTDRSWRIGASRVLRGRTFDEACAALLVGLSHMPHPPAAERNGSVLSVTHRLPEGRER